MTRTFVVVLLALLAAFSFSFCAQAQEQVQTQVAPTYALQQDEGLYALLVRVGCNPGWLSEVMTSNGLTTSDLHHMLVGRAVKIDSATCKETPDSTTIARSRAILREERDYVVAQMKGTSANTDGASASLPGVSRTSVASVPALAQDRIQNGVGGVRQASGAAATGTLVPPKSTSAPASAQIRNNGATVSPASPAQGNDGAIDWHQQFLKSERTVAELRRQLDTSGTAGSDLADQPKEAGENPNSGHVLWLAVMIGMALVAIGLIGRLLYVRFTPVVPANVCLAAELRAKVKEVAALQKRVEQLTEEVARRGKVEGGDEVAALQKRVEQLTEEVAKAAAWRKEIKAAMEETVSFDRNIFVRDAGGTVRGVFRLRSANPSRRDHNKWVGTYDNEKCGNPDCEGLTVFEDTESSLATHRRLLEHLTKGLQRAVPAAAQA
jgi:hypothetical protein